MKHSLPLPALPWPVAPFRERGEREGEGGGKEGRERGEGGSDNRTCTRYEWNTAYPFQRCRGLSLLLGRGGREKERGRERERGEGGRVR